MHLTSACSAGITSIAGALATTAAVPAAAVTPATGRCRFSCDCKSKAVTRFVWPSFEPAQQQDDPLAGGSQLLQPAAAESGGAFLSVSHAAL